MARPKVSVVVPIYNVEKYLRQCLDSIVNQTLKDIEIICVDDGSTDSSPEIIQEYAAKDSRVKVITKPNSGYGNSMNRGFDLAEGEYVGIVESDDYAELDMFEKLYQRAEKNKLDVVKSGYYFYYSVPKERNEKIEIVSKAREGVTFCPATDFRAPMEMVEFFNLKPTIWSAIYRREFIRENNIRFNETPGASFQDSSFNFKVMALAKRVQLTREAFLHYRQDNESSSVNSPGKVFCVCDEYAEMQRFLDTNPVNRGRLEFVCKRIKYDTYMWNFERLAPKYKYIFIERAAMEFQDDFEKGTMNPKYFEDYKWKDVKKLVEDPAVNYTRKALNQPGYTSKAVREIKNSYSYKIGKLITFFPRKFLGGIQSVKDDGIIYTFKLGCKKIARGLAWLKDQRSR